MNGCVYLVTCLENNKKYVGQHHNPDPTRRWNQHKRSKEDFAFQRSLRKYGIDKFTWEVLLICPHEKLTEMEGYYAEVFETYIWDSPGGYNSVWCSDRPGLGIKQSPEAKEKNRQAQLGKKLSPETKGKISQANLGRQSALGKKVSPETKEKIRQANLGKKPSPESKEKNRQAHLGKKMSPEAIEKTRQYWIKRRQDKLLTTCPTTPSNLVSTE